MCHISGTQLNTCLGKLKRLSDFSYVTALRSCELGKCFYGAVISVKGGSLPNLPFTPKTAGSLSILICHTESQDAAALWLGFCMTVESWGNEIPIQRIL